MTLTVLQDLRSRERLPILTVGTGLYLRALLEGLADVPQRSEQLRERLRASAEEHGPGYLHRLLKRLDPETARKIASADDAENNPGRRSMCAGAAADFRSASHGTHTSGRVACVENWIDAAARGALPTHSRTHRGDVGAGLDGRSARSDGEWTCRKTPSLSISLAIESCAKLCAASKSSKQRAPRFSNPRDVMQNAS